MWIHRTGTGGNHYSFRVQKESCACAACATTATYGARGIIDGNPGNDSARAINDALLDDRECR